ncbi:endonuclease domain-containing protein [Hymenobacter sp. CRA2]|uniref:endonuclease domain-containing protein n=1 Tax=Hymenobacter sp. CRA2 TaxID=1955620 RepID=UPI00098F9A83|nr:endonuclease domain-containing protein [Hymenobacter sp. CRA2]OON68201.1 hypothetical protein B0919_13660 [Hymenobacter sp. CRA2]
MPDTKHVHNLGHKKEARQQLRNSATPAEALLWRGLQRSQLAGRKFRRQQSIGPYIVDFYCPSEKLVVELDGAAHYTASGGAYDTDRTAYLNSLGLRVLRFENWLVLQQPDNVLLLFGRRSCQRPMTGKRPDQPPLAPPQLRRRTNP